VRVLWFGATSKCVSAWVAVCCQPYKHQGLTSPHAHPFIAFINTPLSCSRAERDEAGAGAAVGDDDDDEWETDGDEDDDVDGDGEAPWTEAQAAAAAAGMDTDDHAAAAGEISIEEK
jgi:hypothetical protein